MNLDSVVGLRVPDTKQPLVLGIGKPGSFLGFAGKQTNQVKRVDVAFINPANGQISRADLFEELQQAGRIGLVAIEWPTGKGNAQQPGFSQSRERMGRKTALYIAFGSLISDLNESDLNEPSSY